VKKREEEESAAKAYAEFLDAFEGEDAGKNKTGSNFVKASTESQTAYVPALKHISEGPVRSSRAFNTSPSPPSISAPKPKGKRAMDSFLEEIKREQSEREARYSRHAHGHGRSVTALAAYEGQSGSKDRGDPEVCQRRKCLFVSLTCLLDFQCLRCKSANTCHRTESRQFLCTNWTSWLCQNHVASH